MGSISPPLESGRPCDLFWPSEHSKVTLCVFQSWGFKGPGSLPLPSLWALPLPDEEACDRLQDNERPPWEKGLPPIQYQGRPHTGEVIESSPAPVRQVIRWPQPPEWAQLIPDKCPAKPTQNAESWANSYCFSHETWGGWLSRNRKLIQKLYWKQRAAIIKLDNKSS